MSGYPAYLDIAHLTENLCVCERTVDNWVKEGRLPRPKLIGGKRLWKWKEVERYIDGDPNTEQSSAEAELEAIRNGTKTATAKTAPGQERQLYRRDPLVHGK